MGLEELLQETSYLNPKEQERLGAAYQLAESAHRGALRRSGEPYITHPVAVARILAGLTMDCDTLCAGLLHDTVEDTSVTLDQIEQEFGADVRRIVEGETKVSKLTKLSTNLQDEQAENLRQMLIAMTGDIRIILVKLADRLHNMRTLGSMPADRQQRIARETLEIFAPLAHRLGIGQIKWELEDLSFMYLQPEAFQALESQLRSRQELREEQVQDAISRLRQALDRDEELLRWAVRIDIAGRSKHLYSIHNKMLKEHKTLEQIFDLLAVRVILTPKPVQPEELHYSGDIPNEVGLREEWTQRELEKAELSREKRICYHTLGTVHSMWTPIPGRFKDYIAVPKPNGYQSLHTTVISLSGLPIEIQIRSARMHQVAEFGIAAHWLYKQGGDAGEEGRRKASWIGQLEQLQRDIADASDFIDAVKNDLLSGRVFVFTPKGDTVNLPRGATPIDFAYHIHSRIGDNCVGARINGSIVPLNYQLQNGDRVEIIASKQSGGPSKDWMNFAVTRSARAKIRHFFREQERQEALEGGHNALERYLRKRQLPVRQLMRTKHLEEATAKILGSRNPDDLYLALHSGRLTPAHVAKTLAPQLQAETAPPPPLAKSNQGEGIFVNGLQTATKTANCCHPIRGDAIMGYVTRGRGITVHRLDCPNMLRLLKEEPDRCLEASWELGRQADQIADLDLVCVDRPGLLVDVLKILTDQKKSALRVEAGVGGGGVAHIYLRLPVSGRQELAWLADALRRLPDVREVMRLGTGKAASPVPPAYD